MNRRTLYAALFLPLCLLAPVPRAHAADPASGPAPRIGVYDSRAVAIAWARTPAAGARFRKLREDLAKAKAAGDSARTMTLEKEGRWAQVRLHQQGFSTVGVGAMLATVADRLPGVAKAAGVSLLVSKWELPYVGNGVGTVDVTMELVKLFNPDVQTLHMVPEITRTAPVAFDELGLDPND